jgi:hypothetical protein
MNKSHHPKIHAKAAPRNAKHTVSANAHKSGSLKINHHKGGGKRQGKKTILK